MADKSCGNSVPFLNTLILPTLYDSVINLTTAELAILSEPITRFCPALNAPELFLTRILVVETLTIVAENPPDCVTTASATKPDGIVGLPLRII